MLNLTDRLNLDLATFLFAKEITMPTFELATIDGTLNRLMPYSAILAVSARPRPRPARPFWPAPGPAAAPGSGATPGEGGSRDGKFITSGCT